MGKTQVHAHIVLQADTLPKFLAALKAVGDMEVLVGFPESTAERDDEDGITNAYLGAIMDKGSPAQGIPASHFMDKGIEEAKAKIETALSASAGAVLDGNLARAEGGQDAAGLAAVTGIRRKIIAGPWKPLAASTLAARRRRGVTRTARFIDTGQLIAALTYIKRKIRRT